MYKLITWPESQEIIERANKEGWINECFLANPEGSGQDWVGGSAYFVPNHRLYSLEKVNRENLPSHMFRQMLALVGKTEMQVIENDRWRFDWTITRQQHQEFKIKMLFILRKVLKINKTKAEEEFDWFYQKFGLRIKNQ